MDETLVHTRSDSPPSHSNYVRSDFGGEPMFVEPRPMVQEFLRAVSEVFTIYVYTAGKKNYADKVLKVIDSEGLIEKRFYRDSCRKVGGKLVKDLKHIQRTLRVKDSMVLVDDNKDSVNHNYPFAVPIEAFEGDQKDSTLSETFKQVLKFYV